MKITIIGAGNVGAQAALHIAEIGLGDVYLIDIAKGLAQGKSLDLEDACSVEKVKSNIFGSLDIQEAKDSDIIVITAGLTRKPGMLREELLQKNSQILKEISLKIKTLAPKSIVIVVTNPLDIMTYLVLKTTGFSPRKVFGMGPTLDAARFSNLISKELGVSPADINSVVIGSHGEGMMPLARLTLVKGVRLDEYLNEEKINELIRRTGERGKEIVSHLGAGSAYFAPALAITELVEIMAKDSKTTVGICAYLNGEYGLRDLCIGVPCLLGKNGIEKIVELDLDAQEMLMFKKSADSLLQLNLQIH